jgi:ubiquinone/menaquinone biosynthesis C-methylase UbiE
MTADWKQRAIELWTVDPCGPEASSARELLDKRREYAPWMADELDYSGAVGLDVLDVGCGQGIDLCEYALCDADVTGIDLTPRHVELAQNHLAELLLAGTVLLGDAERLPFGDATFDRVSSNGVLHHTPDMPAALAEMHRVLRPGGRTTVIVYNRDSSHFWVQQILVNGILRRGLWKDRGLRGLLAHVEKSTIGARPLVTVYSRRRLRQMLVGAGFREVMVKASPSRPEDNSVTARLGIAPPGGGWYLIGRGLH